MKALTLHAIIWLTAAFIAFAIAVSDAHSATFACSTSFCEGTPEADVITGDGTANTIAGRAGDDALRGRGGPDTLEGNRGADRLRGGAGEDLLRGNDGDDVIFATEKNAIVEDWIYCGDGTDVVFGYLKSVDHVADDCEVFFSNAADPNKGSNDGRSRNY